MPPKLAFSLAAITWCSAALSVAMTAATGCAAQHPACQIIKLADEACVMIEGRDGEKVRVPIAELHRVAIEAKMREQAASHGSASASPVAPASSAPRNVKAP